MLSRAPPSRWMRCPTRGSWAMPSRSTTSRSPSGRMALAKSTNENVRAFASRAVAVHTEAAQFLSKARSEAGVSYAPDPTGPPNTQAILQRLNGLRRARVRHGLRQCPARQPHDADDQYGAYSQNGGNGALAPLRPGQAAPRPRSSSKFASAGRRPLLERRFRPSRHVTKPRLRKAQAGHSPQP